MTKRVSLFVTCVVDQLLPRAGLAMAEVLAKVGYEVEFRPAQTCCGRPAYEAGCREQAQQVGAAFQRTFADAEYVVTPSTSCATMLRKRLPELCGPSMQKGARETAGRVWEFSRFLVEVARVEDVGARFEHPVVVQEAEGLHGGVRLLSHVKGLQQLPLSDWAGSGHLWGHREPVSPMLVQRIAASGASHVVGMEAERLLLLRGALERGGHAIETVHLAEVLASR
jgi:L-lactate dehydrogenase complex protein LldE